MFGKRARPLSLARLDSSPKGRALGSTVNFSVLPKAPPFLREDVAQRQKGKFVTESNEEGEDAYR